MEELRPSYCPVCDEAGPRGHQRICTVCGAELQERQGRRPQGSLPALLVPRITRATTAPSSPRGAARTTEAAVAAVTRRPASDASRSAPEERPRGRNNDDDDDSNEGEASGSEGGTLAPPPQGDGAAEVAEGAGGNVELLLLLEQTISDLRRQQQQGFGGGNGSETDPSVLRRVNDLRQVTESLTRAQAGVRQMLLRLADLAGDPSALSSSSRPTAPAYLDAIPRIALTPQSTVFAEATVTVNGTAYRAVPGDFGVNHLAHRLSGASIVYCGTGKGGMLGAQAMAQIQEVLATRSSPSASSDESPTPLVLLFDRGGDVTFVRKAMLAQQFGACAAIVANHVSQPWPYRMADSSNEAPREGLRIPVVMVRKEDAHAILAVLRQGGDAKCDVEILPAGKSAECAVCLQSMQAGETILVLPACRHAFHEACALTWLRSHHTCPYCRSELPTSTNESPSGGNNSNRNNEQPRVGANRGSLPSNSGSDEFYG